MFSSALSLQEKYAPSNACFGCGPANELGLKLRSFPENGKVVATWQPKPQYEAFPGVLNGGIIGTLLDCHSNWTAAWFLMQQSGESEPPCTVTAEYSVKLKRPTPSNVPITLIAEVVDSNTNTTTATTTTSSPAKNNSAIVRAQLVANDKVCATCEGRFVAVSPGHPGYYRW